MRFIYFNQKYFSNVPEKLCNDELLLVPEPWLFFKNKFIRLLCHICLSPRINSHIKMPFRSFWLKRILSDSFKLDEEICMIVNSHFYNICDSRCIKKVKKRFKKSFFVLSFSDKVEYFSSHYHNFPQLKSLQSIFDLVITYNTDDSKKYNIILDRPCIPKYNLTPTKNNQLESDLFFVGSNKGRINVIYDIFEKAVSHGIKCDFHVTNVPINEMRHSDSISFNKQLSYSEVLERVSKTKCILNIVQQEGNGITLRDYEAIFFDKMMLTNNRALSITGLYTREQVVWLEEIDSRIDDLKRGYLNNNNLKKEYTFEKWILWLKDSLTAKKQFINNK